jgi:PleD family two-component response regulator
MMFNLPDSEVERRMVTLNEVLAKNAVHATSEPHSVRVSFGVAGFSSMTQIGGAIEKADLAMYQKRQRARRRSKVMQFV